MPNNNAADFRLEGTLAYIDITGNAATATSAISATNASNASTVSTGANAAFFPLFVASSTNSNQPFNLGAGLSFNPSTNNLATTTFTGALVGNATTATNATNANNGATVATTTNASFFPLFVASSTNSNQPFNLGTGLSFNPSTNNLTAGTFTGAWQGDVISPVYGGTGVNNGASTIILGGPFSTVGAFSLALNLSGDTSVILPTSGTLATTAQIPVFTWQAVSVDVDPMVVSNGYVVSNNNAPGVPIELTLPSGAALGSEIRVLGFTGTGDAGFRIMPLASQQINYGIQSTTPSTGYLQSNNTFDCVTLTCVSSDGNSWNAYGTQGNFLVF